MADAEVPSTLAALRRSRGQRSRHAAQGSELQHRWGPGLFDELPADAAHQQPQAKPPAPPAPAPSVEQTPQDRLNGVTTAIVLPQAPLPIAEPELAEVKSTATAAAPMLWTVSGLVRHVREVVERGYARVTVEGEISNWRPAGSGHCYFTVKDAGAQLSAVLFRRQAALLRFQPRDGDAVKLHGQLSVYEGRGQMQLIVEWVQQAGLGALLAEVQRLKEQLRREGLFDRKRPLPPFPRCIGVITSLHGAALRDIVKVCRRRHAAVQLLIYPAAVQGPNCVAEVRAGLRWFNAHPETAEVVLVARGGGSWEDLHGFDHEQVVRAIAACMLPVITGIGHATDTTIADAAADVCAPTPSAAAELLTAAQHRVEERVATLHDRLLRATRYHLLRAQQRVARTGVAAVRHRAEAAVHRREQRVDELMFRLQSALASRLRRTQHRLGTAERRLAQASPRLRLQTTGRRLEMLQLRLERAAGRQPGRAHRQLETAQHRLEALSPLRVLQRGYALVYNAEGHLLRSAGEAVSGDRVRARLAHGELTAEVLTVHAAASLDRRDN